MQVRSTDHFKWQDNTRKPVQGQNSAIGTQNSCVQQQHWLWIVTRSQSCVTVSQVCTEQDRPAFPISGHAFLLLTGTASSTSMLHSWVYQSSSLLPQKSNNKPPKKTNLKIKTGASSLQGCWSTTTSTRRQWEHATSRGQDCRSLDLDWIKLLCSHTPGCLLLE